jgi:hypothetical protein
VRRAVAVAVAVTAFAGIAGAPGAWGAPARHFHVTPPGAGPGFRAPAAIIDLDRSGALSLRVTVRGRIVVRRSELGIETTAGHFDNGLALERASVRDITGGYTTVVGKRRRHRVSARVLALALHTPAGDRMILVVRVDADGVAYRYVVPSRGHQRLVAEHSTLLIDEEAGAYLAIQQPDHPIPPNTSAISFYEAPRRELAAGAAVGDWQFPALFDTGRGTWLLATESGLGPGYAGMHLRGLGGGRFALAPPAPDPTVSVNGTLTTPWRVLVVGGLRRVVASDLVQDLAAPSRVRDTSWIRPGRVAWSWYSDWESPTSFARQRAFVDYAASQGWEYTLVDEGWSPSWMPKLVRYARRRGVRILVWARYSDLATRAQRNSRLPRWRRWGVAGVKIDFVLCDCQARQRWYARVLAQTAKLHLLVNFHGTTIPRGTERTWPQVLTMEAVPGEELYAFQRVFGIPVELNPPEAQLMLPFTRNVVGPMDFTPVALSPPALDFTSAGYQLAEAVVFESGLQHWADSPENYAGFPLAQRVLRQVPTTWDETRLLAGRPGRYAVIARRRARTWWIGAMAAIPTQPRSLALRFLGPGRWRLFAVADDGGGNLAARTKVVSAHSNLSLSLAARGGWVTRIVRAPHRG